MQLNTKMMVGALHCRDKTPRVVENYNTFVAQHRGMLEAHHAILQSRFDREGISGEGSVDYRDFVTVAANQHSGDPATRDVGDCASIVSLARMASAMSDTDLLMLAQSVTKAPASGPCRPSRYSFEEEPGPVGSAPVSEVEQLIAARQPWEPLPAVAAAVAAAPAAPASEAALRPKPTEEPAVALEVAPTAVLAEAPAVVAEEARAAATPTPATKVAAATEAPAVAKASDGSVLNAAVAALQAATAALQMAMQTPAQSPAPAQSATPESPVPVEGAPLPRT
jgi:hypothetical protein